MKEIINKYSTFIKYLFSAGTSFLLDLGLFTIFTNFFKKFIGDSAIIVGTILARIISSFYNYLMNRNAVFGSKDKKMDKTTFIQYYGLVLIQMIVSALLVWLGHKLFPISETIVKIPVDVVLFMMNYFIQKKWIFNKR